MIHRSEEVIGKDLDCPWTLTERCSSEEQEIKRVRTKNVKIRFKNVIKDTPINFAHYAETKRQIKIDNSKPTIRLNRTISPPLCI